MFLPQTNKGTQETLGSDGYVYCGTVTCVYIYMSELTKLYTLIICNSLGIAVIPQKS